MSDTRRDMNGKNGGHAKGHGHVTKAPDVSHIKNIDVTHEMSDVSVSSVLKFVAGLTVMMVVVFGLMWALFYLLSSQEQKKDQAMPPGPMAMTEQERLPPDPKLQAAPGFGVKLANGQWVNLESDKMPGQPQAEYRVLRQQWEEVLQNGKSDPSGKVVVLPIREAMKQLLESNTLPTRTSAPQSGSLDDGTIATPTAASSGRVAEKRKQ